MREQPNFSSSNDEVPIEGHVYSCHKARLPWPTPENLDTFKDPADPSKLCKELMKDSEKLNHYYAVEAIEGLKKIAKTSSKRRKLSGSRPIPFRYS